jgi:hypothetical protein
MFLKIWTLDLKLFFLCPHSLAVNKIKQLLKNMTKNFTSYAFEILLSFASIGWIWKGCCSSKD